MKPRIIFFGSDWGSLFVLNSLVSDKRFKIVGIVTLPAKPQGRKQALTPNPVEQYAKTLFEIKFFPFKRFNRQSIDRFKKLKADVGILAWYGKILPKEILEIPKHGVLNVHPSLLPKYRGPSPVQAAILNGDKKAGVTIFKMDEQMDHGPILVQFKEEIKPDDTSQSLYERLFTVGGQSLATILPSYLEGKIKLRKQNHKMATYTRLLNRDSGKICWQDKDKVIERFIRAMHPWPGAWTRVKIPGKRKPKRLKILKAHLERGKLVLDQVQLEGKKPVTYSQFQAGYPSARIMK